MTRWALGAVSVLALVLAQNNPTVSIKRDNTNIVITNLAPRSEGARTLPRNPNCKEGFDTGIFYGPVEGFVETLSQEAKLISTVVITEKPSGSNDSEEAERVELFNADVTFNRPGCPEEITRNPDTNITLEQGRTTVTGKSMVLEPKENVGNMKGPVLLNRASAGDSPALEASSEELDFDFDTDTSVLKGNVTVSSEDRSSQADELEYDEANAIAIMRGSPAISTDSEGSVQGDIIIYYLDTNDVVVKGSLAGEINVDLGRGNTPAAVTPQDETPPGDEFGAGFGSGDEFNDIPVPTDPRQFE